MAAFHYHRSRTSAEREVDAAVDAAYEQVAVMQARVNALEDRIVAVRHEVAAAGLLDPFTMSTPERQARRRRALAPARRIAVARAALRNL